MNITYLIGAGASAQALPVVDENFNNRFILFCRILIDNKREFEKPEGSHYKEFLEKVIMELPLHYSTL